MPGSSFFPWFWSLLVVFGGFSAPAFSQAPGPETPLRVAFYDYGLLYSHGTGIDADVVRELEQRSGKTFLKSVLARARIWRDLESGQLDMTVSGIATPVREQYAWFIPYFSMKNYVLLPRGFAAGPRSFQDHPAWTFGAVASFRHGLEQDAFLDALRKQGRVEEAPDAFTLFQKLKAGRIQGMFSQPPVYQFYLETLGMKDLVQVQDWFPAEQKVPHGLVLSRKRFSQREYLYWKDLLEGMRKDGTLEKILIRHLGSPLGSQLLEVP